ncbi:MAG: hypothetical protein MUE40_06965 [Anaerolineae bacterium]|jgi:hypothetical protein|nr:hypothetical protein [Anaerolineae bacterium]
MLRPLLLVTLGLAGLAACTVLTRSPIEPLVGLLIFWATLLVPALLRRLRRAWPAA